MQKEKCESCLKNNIDYYHETVRRPDGSGTILSLCKHCRIKLLRIKK